MFVIMFAHFTPNLQYAPQKYNNFPAYANIFTKKYNLLYYSLRICPKYCTFVPLNMRVIAQTTTL